MRWASTGFWLGDDSMNIAFLYELEQQGRLLPGTFAYFANGLSRAGSFYRPFSIVCLAGNYVAAGVSYGGWYLVSFAVHLDNVLLIA
jgi:hypothetical protein